ncbi:uncharacterized protein LOC122023191 [Zingiber officinale]|uniref:uncharacterized protein LOC122023191 n=1 Tax=Zingiber officinale TaxID=94328 RepID=UPI001C4B97FB|nr:uncharacterized protein LOC122023191 [Zingiber officinale]
MVRVEARKNQRMRDGGIHAVQEKPSPMAEEPIPWEEVQLYAELLESLTRVANDLPSPLKEELVQCLIHNRDVFAWSTEELPGVRPEDEDCTRAFEELKKYLETLPSLFKPVVGEPLWVYLSATPEAIGAVLVKEHDNVQRPVYFFIHLLKGAESRYTTLEKLVYGLVLMARRLRPYFLAHPIIVLTNSSMGRALTNVEVVGRLIKWATELGEYDIQYQPRTAIKAQALADFLTEIHQTNSEETWKIYVDGSANHQESGVGVLMISSQGDILQLAVRLNFRATNNEAEYEALLAGLQAARHVGAARVIIYSYSQIVTQQIVGNFMLNGDKLQVYREAYEKMREEFTEVTVTKIPRLENERADELAKMASSLTTWVLDRSMTQTFLIAQIDLQNNREAAIDWQAPMINYLRQSILPTDPEESRLIRKQAHAYVMIRDQLYKRSFSPPLLKCLGIEEADQALREIHLGCCGNHKHQNLTHRPIALLRTSIVSCPFDQWGMDIVGPFPMAPNQRRLLLVAVDYISKWVEAEALARITEDAVIQFLWKNILCRFGIPHKLVSEQWKTEVVNREIVRGLKIKLDHVGGNWVEELSSILWAYRITPRESTGLITFHLVYGNEAVVPIEIGVPSVRRTLYDEGNTERWLVELDLISETRDKTAARLEAYQQRMRQNYNRRVIPRLFGEGDLVWKQIKPVGDVTKLVPQWDGPYKVIKKLLSGAYYLQDERGKKLDRPWSANYMQPYRV